MELLLRLLHWLLSSFSSKQAEEGKIIVVGEPGLERLSPKIRIKNTQIELSLRTGNITIKGLGVDTLITTVANTNSMDPVFDYGMFLFLQPIKDCEDLIPGDIVIYQMPELSYAIIHRIIDITLDDNKKRHYLMLGDNNQGVVDQYDVMDEHLLYLYRGHIS